MLVYNMTSPGCKAELHYLMFTVVLYVKKKSLKSF